MKLVQIGSNRGYDDFTEIVKNINPSDVDLLLLIEPNEELNSDLHDCYYEYSPVIENVVINTDENEEKTKFYVFSNTHYSELSSLSCEHLIKHYVDSDIIEKEIRCYTINNLFEKYKIVNLDVLFIDAEGLDYELITSIDFEKYNINKIYYENLHINNDLMVSFLDLKNYKVNRNVLMNGWTSEAYK
jgi:hypothetical protein